MTDKPLHFISPLKHSQIISKKCNLQVFLKLENVQPPGSFKIRGIGHLCQTHAQKGCKRFICSSGGNAGLAAAHAARKLNIPITICVPSTTQKFTINQLKDLGAEVVVVGSVWDECNEHALQLSEQPGHVYISPFNDPLIWEGHATVITELEMKPDLVVCSVGGGGLFLGVIEGLKQKGWSDVPVLTVETVGADSLFQSVSAKSLVTLPGIVSIAKSLGAKTVAQAALDAALNNPVISHAVSDQDCLQTLLQFLDDEKLLIEPACAASLVPFYNGDINTLMQSNSKLKGIKNIAVIVCGGTQVNIGMVDKWKREVGL